jgi:membrane dipeptidase
MAMPDLSKPDWKVSERARKIHAEALVWDDHAGFEPDPKVDLEILENWRAAGVDYLSVNVGYDVVPWQKTIKNIGAFITWLEKNTDRFTLVRTVGDIDAAKREGKLAIAFDIEGMNSLDGEAYMVSFYYRLGVRQMLFAYNLNNLAGSGCHDKDTGLTEFGRQVIAEMNRVGMLVDCSHTGLRTTLQAMEASTAPCIFSHSNPVTLHKHGRNIVDDQIKACARTGGVVGINGIGLFLGDPAASTPTLVRAITYVADMVGIDHVGVSLDWTPENLEGLTAANPQFWPKSEGYGQGSNMRVAAPKQLPEITEMLLERGYGEEDVRKVMGGNFRRVAAAVWK